MFQAISIKSLGEKILYAMTHMEIAFKDPVPSFDAKDLWIGIAAALLFKALLY